jgi:predicted ABC-type sugar transport system permease subunit
MVIVGFVAGDIRRGGLRSAGGIKGDKCFAELGDGSTAGSLLLVAPQRLEGGPQGTSLMGGEGSIAGAIVASLLNCMSVMNMPAFWQFIIRGLVLIIAVYIDVATKRNRSV